MEPSSPSPRAWRLRYRRISSLFCMESPLPSPSKPTIWKQDELPQHHSRPPPNRKYLSARREIGTTISLSAAGTATIFFIIFFLGAESSLMSTTLSQSPFAFYTRSQSFILSHRTLSSVERDLHSFHAVPLRYIRALPADHQQTLLNLLSTPPSNNSLAPPTRKAIFAHVKAHRVQPCLRAMAAVVAYAMSTGRVAVLFVENIDRKPLSEMIQLGNGGLLTEDAIAISIDHFSSQIIQPRDDHLKDWAEFSVSEAVIPSNLLTNSTSQPPTSIIPLSQDPSMLDDDADASANLPHIGNTRHIATLDSLAALDTHVSVTLSEVIWSNYAPRAIQEAILATVLQPHPTFSSEAILSASLLGRYKHTRSMENVDSTLRNTFHIPQMLLTGMAPIARRLLLLKLMSKRRKGVKTPRAFFVHAQYGLGNRLRALGSAMAFARRTDRVLVLIWVADQHLDCKYTDLFVASDEFVVADNFEPGEEWPFHSNRARDAEMQHVKWYNFMRVNGVQANSPSEEVDNDAKLHIYASTCYVIQSSVTPFIIRTQSSFWQVLRSLTPHVAVARLIERFASYPMSNMIGVHIRGKTIATDIQGVSAADYSEESSRRTDYWRNLTQVDTFIEEMKRQRSDQLFYVAADQKDVLTRLEAEFPSRVFYTPRKCDSRGKECLKFALADILLLAQCSSLRGSYWSSFSELSVRIGGARFLLAGIDFGRPETTMP